MLCFNPKIVCFLRFKSTYYSYPFFNLKVKSKNIAETRDYSELMRRSSPDLN